MKVLRSREFTAARAWGALDIANLNGDLLQESWTEMSVGVSEQFPHSEREVRDETQAVLGGTDRGSAQAG